MSDVYYITAIEPLPRDGRRMHICLDGAEDICLYRSETRKLGLKPGMELCAEDYENIIEEILLPRAKSRALHLLERQDRTRAGLLKKLKEGGYTDSLAEAAVEYAGSYHYIDDLRYAKNYIYFHKHEKSKRRIITDLLRKGVERDTVCRAIDEDYDADEGEQIARLMKKKRFDPASADDAQRSKMYRFLMARGFESARVTEALSGDYRYEDTYR